MKSESERYYEDKRILVTGGNGFLGSHVMDSLRNIGAEAFTFSSKEYDITTWDNCDTIIHDFKPDVIIHCAADVGGIEYNKNNPGSIFFNNVSMSLNLLESCRLFRVKRFIGIGSVCAYPKICPVPFKEENLWDGYPEETNGPYGMSKKMMLVQSKAYEQQYEMECAHLLMVNLYGPRDNFSDESSHVIPALIKRFSESKKKNKKTVTAWGDGSPTREFLYVEDAAAAVVKATASCNTSDPINIGSGEEISIKTLTETIAKHVGYEGKIEWDTTKPNGQPRRCLDVSKAKEEFDFSAQTKFEDGIKKTIEWYEENDK